MGGMISGRDAGQGMLEVNGTCLVVGGGRNSAPARPVGAAARGARRMAARAMDVDRVTIMGFVQGMIGGLRGDRVSLPQLEAGRVGIRPDSNPSWRSATVSEETGDELEDTMDKDAPRNA